MFATIGIVRPTPSIVSRKQRRESRWFLTSATSSRIACSSISSLLKSSVMEIEARSANGCGPESQGANLSASTSFNNLIRPQQHRLWNRQPKCLRGLEVDHQLKLGRLLDWDVAGLRAFQDFVDERRGSPVQIGNTGPIGHETADVHEFSVSIYRRQSSLLGEAQDLTSARKGSRIRRYDNHRLRARLRNH